MIQGCRHVPLHDAACLPSRQQSSNRNRLQQLFPSILRAGPIREHLHATPIVTLQRRWWSEIEMIRNLGTLRVYVFAHTTNRIDVELGARLFRHLMALPIAYFQARRVGDSVARVRELENIREFLTSSALTLVIDFLFTFVFLAVMFYYSTTLTFVVLASLPFYIGISAGAAPLFRRRLDEKFNRGAENRAFLVESVTGVETLKSMAVEPQMQRRWEEQLAAYVTASFRVLSLNNTASQAVQTFNKLVIAAILYFGAKLVIGGEMSVGELVAFNMLATRVNQPVLRLAQLWQDFHQARLSIDRLGDILNIIPEASVPAVRRFLQSAGKSRSIT